MKITMESKFEIGEIVRVKGTVCKILIQAIHTDTCTAGTQVAYHALNLIPLDRFRFEDSSGNKSISYAWEKEVRINEALLEKCE